LQELLEADDGDRTRDPQLGKLMLYQLSYVRAPRQRYHRSGPALAGRQWLAWGIGGVVGSDEDVSKIGRAACGHRPSAGGVRLTSTRPRRRQQGQTMAEYAVILGVITPVLVLLFSGLGEPLVRRLEMVTSFLL
jgi:Flp pilus assembly pilin Flp